MGTLLLAPAQFTVSSDEPDENAKAWTVIFKVQEPDLSKTGIALKELTYSS